MSAITYDKDKAIDKYNLCYKNYVTLNNKYISVKDLALQSNESIVNRLMDMVIQFDSCMLLLKSSEQRPSKSPAINIETIETYRLDGLLRPNIQTDTLQLWDYGSWAKSTLKIINSDIQQLRKSINECDKNFSTAIKSLSSKNSQEIVSVPVLPKEVVNLLNKFDYNSLPYNILAYKREKADLLVSSKDPINSSSKTNFSENARRQSYFYEMYSQAIRLDSMLKKLKSFQLYKEYPK
ncbi:MAG: hypothetical protein K2Q22_07410, partial [Cytophagales bacterium]|nr:hypothetical protein [Cytophagales bacterium]